MRGTQIAKLLMVLTLACSCSSDDGGKPAADAGKGKDQSVVPDTGPRQDAADDQVADSKSVADEGIAPDQQQQGCVHPEVTKSCTNGWCEVPAGCFVIGSPTGELCRDEDETQHEVTLTRSFSIMEAEVTQSDFDALMGYNPSSHAGCANCPVESVSWYEAAAYCNKLSEDKGLASCYACTGAELTLKCTVVAKYDASGDGLYACPGYRLPTPAEWEYAARAGTTTALYNGAVTDCTGTDSVVDAVAWYDKNSGGTTHEVKGKQPNAWGLYDMSGNVFEWTADGWITDWGSEPRIDPWVSTIDISRRMRGGSYKTPAGIQRLANRASKTVGDPTPLRYDELGFRCARSLDNTIP